jgi:dynein heavy chain
VTNDTSLLYGEILDSPLETFKSLLSSTYAPLFAESNEWGSATEEQKSDFTEELNKFMQNLSSAVDSLSRGLELRQISPRYTESLDTDSDDKTQPSPEAIAYFEGLVSEWCAQIGEFIDSRASENDSQSGKLEGPKGEVEYWRTRTQQLSSINDQLRRQECRYVIGILSAYTKGVLNDQAKMKTVALLRKWKQIDIETTEAANEAKDNLKYLSTLQRFVEPLYSGTAQSIIDTLPALINSIKVCRTVACCSFHESQNRHLTSRSCFTDR